MIYSLVRLKPLCTVLSLFLLTSGCQRQTVDVDALANLDGTYKALYTVNYVVNKDTTTYPIDHQELLLTIAYSTSDTAQIRIQKLTDGVVQYPNQDVLYRKVLIQNTISSQGGKGCWANQVYLNGDSSPRADNYLVSLCNEPVIDYFTTMGVIRFTRLP